MGDAGRRVLLLRAICICVHFGELTVVFLHLVSVGYWHVSFVVCFYPRHRICGRLFVPHCVLRDAPAVILRTAINAVGVASSLASHCDRLCQSRALPVGFSVGCIRGVLLGAP